MTLVKLNQPSRQRNLIDDWFQDFPAYFSREASPAFSTTPVNIVETTDAYHLELTAPGRSKEDIKLQVEDGLLTISYEHKKEEKTEDFKVVRKEFSLASFKRSFSLDEKIDTAGIQAKYENGVLKVFLPKKAEVKLQPQAINIQ
ncbi:Hsp20/alpha crystallin family protein [Flavihumibacter petaseus]|uniref:Putative Hsp20 family protein n=1 Tax=Flavihumibacter petaseus NBRC 106054 TaxID=1220578 RepID=A0A0E9N291_9BACT|nr:Hsp20/alpha crystallin family protein [Flavihumibacter petaseus]GAO43949.1 putative Hsp20 family protein [Flavihumibacter petaseus NBRC 106054]